MKVLFNTYPIAFDCPGGGEVQLLQTKEALEKEGETVLLYDIWKPQLREADVVHYFSVFGGSSVFCNYVKSLNKPLAVSPILYPHQNLERYPIAEISHILNIADIILPNSAHEADLLANVFKIPLQKFHVAHNGVADLFMEKPSFTESLFRTHFKVDFKYLLCVGNIEDRKNQLRLAKALKNTDLHLILLGNVRDQVYFNETIAASNGKIHYLGHLPHDSVLLRSAYLGCEAFVLPSLLETPGLAALEAAAMGCKLVITEVGSTQEYFSTDAHYANPESEPSILNAILIALQNPRAPALQDHIRQNFTWRSTAKQTLQAYQKILS